MIKFRLYFDKDAETDWLNEMSAKGWAMESFFMGFYDFEKCEKEQYLYQVDFNNELGVSREYREFMQEAGIEIVQSWFFWRILRKPASEGPFQLYTDLESRIAYYSKIRVLYKVVAIIEAICVCMETMVVIEGNYYQGIPLVFLFAAFFGLFFRMAIRTTDIINDLKEKQTGIPAKRRRRNFSLLLAAGMAVNSLALFWNNASPGPMSHLLQIAAIVLMLAGVWDTVRKREE